MNRVLLSLCLFGAALATANALFVQGPVCRSVANETSDLSSARNITPPPGKNSTLSDDAAKNTASAASAQDITGAIRADETTPKALSAAKPSTIETHVSEWAEVTVAVKVRSGPSLSAAIIRYYRAGAKLRVLERQMDWTKIVDPATSKDGWIYARYLSPTSEPSQAQVDTRQEQPFGEPRRRGWRWYASQQRPRFRLVFGVHPRW